MWQARSTTELASNLGEKGVPILLTHYSFSEYNWVEFELTLNIYIYLSPRISLHSYTQLDSYSHSMSYHMATQRLGEND